MTTDQQTTDEQQTIEVSDKPKFSLPSKLAIGVGVVGLLVGGGAGFGLAQIGDSTPAKSSTATLTLPSTLSGNFKRNATVDGNLKASLVTVKSTLGAGADMALYANGTSQVLVEAARVGGILPLSAGMTYAKVGDAICASATSANGSEAICTRGNNALTIKVTATDQATAAKYVNEIYTAIA